MFSSKDFEKLWFLYQTEGVPEEESINSFCEKNGVPYEEFDKWFRKTHQAVGRVEIENIPDDEPMPWQAGYRYFRNAGPLSQAFVHRHHVGSRHHHSS